MNSKKQKCPECDGKNLYVTEVTSGGLYGPVLLPGLAGFLRMAKFRVLVCSGCGLTRFYAEAAGCAKLPSVKGWWRV